MTAMTRSELILQLANKSPQLYARDVEEAVHTILGQMSESLSFGGRVEIRGFGSFSVNHRAPRKSRNPKTGETLMKPETYAPHFKAGKDLRERVNENAA